MFSLEYVRAYTNDLFVITMGTYDDHVDKVEAVLDCLQPANLRVNVKASSFVLHTLE